MALAGSLALTAVWLAAPGLVPWTGATAGLAPTSIGTTTQEVGPPVADFVGAAVCGECHVDQLAAWQGSTHGRAGGPAGPETVIAPFDGTPIEFADATVIPAVSEEGAYTFTVRRPGRADVAYTVDGVIGRGHMVGGGTQGFVSRMPDGTVRFLPFDYSRHGETWFCNTGRAAGWWTSGDERARPRTDEGWIPVTPDLRLAECGDWPPVRVLGTDFRFGNCQGCHGSQITVALNPVAGRYETQVGSLAINCESCHGPGRRHVDLARNADLSVADDAGITQPALLDEDASLELCFQCHALKRALQAEYLPGDDFATHYSLLLPQLGDRPFYPDGRVRTFAYQQNHRQSACYLDGAMTCVDCHDPHGPGYRDLAAEPLPDRFDDGQCVDCHASKAGEPTLHTGHPAESEGSRCVACHMPYLQQPELGDRIRYARSDHTIPLPRPGADESMGVPSACALCHQGRTTEELAAWTREQWGELKPHEPVEAALLEAERLGAAAMGNREALALLRPEDPNAMPLVAGVNHLLDGYLRPDMPELDPEVAAALQALTDHPDPDVRSVALVALHVARGDDPGVRRFLSDKVAVLGEQQESVLRRWLTGLRFIGDGYRRRGDPVTALQVVRKGLEIAPTDAGVLLDMGALFDAVGDVAEAAGYYQRSLEADWTQSVGWVNLGQAFEAGGDPLQAERAYEQALVVYSGEALAHLNLGNLRLAAGDYPAAVQRYTQALEFDPGLAGGWFNLALAHLGLAETGLAAEALRASLEIDPLDQEARDLLARIENQPDLGR
jgi:tetratricopeptide (TPR) repeat protein